MRCENVFCIYYRPDDQCRLSQDSLHLDLQGRCTDCIYVDLPSDQLEAARRRILSRYQD